MTTTNTRGRKAFPLTAMQRCYLEAHGRSMSVAQLAKDTGLSRARILKELEKLSRLDEHNLQEVSSPPPASPPPASPAPASPAPRDDYQRKGTAVVMTEAQATRGDNVSRGPELYETMPDGSVRAREMERYKDRIHYFGPGRE